MTIFNTTWRSKKCLFQTWWCWCGALHRVLIRSCKVHTAQKLCKGTVPKALGHCSIQARRVIKRRTTYPAFTAYWCPQANITRRESQETVQSFLMFAEEPSGQLNKDFPVLPRRTWCKGPKIMPSLQRKGGKWCNQRRTCSKHAGFAREHSLSQRIVMLRMPVLRNDCTCWMQTVDVYICSQKRLPSLLTSECLLKAALHGWMPSLCFFLTIFQPVFKHTQHVYKELRFMFKSALDL